MNLNRAELIGNLTADPVARAMPSGKEVVTFTVATGRDWNNDGNERHHEVEYHPVAAYGKLGEVVAKYLKKGDKVYLDGRLKTQGNGKSGRTIVIAANLIMLGGKKHDTKVNDDVVQEEIEVDGEGV